MARSMFRKFGKTETQNYNLYIMYMDEVNHRLRGYRLAQKLYPLAKVVGTGIVTNKIKEHAEEYIKDFQASTKEVLPSKIQYALIKEEDTVSPFKKNIYTKYKMPSKKYGVQLKGASRFKAQTVCTDSSGKKFIPKPSKTVNRIKQAKLIKKVNKLNKKIEADQSTHTHRYRNVNQRLCSTGLAPFSAINNFTVSDLQTAMANLRYYDPSAPTVPITADASSGTFSRNITIDKLYSKTCIQNNYQVPVNVTVYLFEPRDDTSVTVGTYHSNGVSDQAVGAGYTSNSVLCYPTDINMLMDTYRITKSKSKRLMPGAQLKMGKAFKSFKFNPALFDTHNLEYQHKYRSHVWAIRLEGDFGHDNAVANQLNTLAGGVDTYTDITIKFIYDGGKSFDDFSATNNSDTFTNAGVVSNRPVVDNQGYTYI